MQKKLLVTFLVVAMIAGAFPLSFASAVGDIDYYDIADFTFIPEYESTSWQIYHVPEPEGRSDWLGFEMSLGQVDGYDRWLIKDIFLPDSPLYQFSLLNEYSAGWDYRELHKIDSLHVQYVSTYDNYRVKVLFHRLNPTTLEWDLNGYTFQYYDKLDIEQLWAVDVLGGLIQSEEFKLEMTTSDNMLYNGADWGNVVRDLIVKTKGYTNVDIMINSRPFTKLEVFDRTVLSVADWPDYFIKGYLVEGFNVIRVTGENQDLENYRLDDISINFNYVTVPDVFDGNFFLTMSPMGTWYNVEHLKVTSLGYKQIQWSLNGSSPVVNNSTLYPLGLERSTETIYSLELEKHIKKGHNVIEFWAYDELFPDNTVSQHYAFDFFYEPDDPTQLPGVDKPTTPVMPDSPLDVFGWLTYFGDWIVYIFSGITHFLAVIYGSIADLMTKAGAITNLLGTFFSFLPSPIPQLLVLGIALLILVGLLRR